MAGISFSSPGKGELLNLTEADIPVIEEIT
jgi:hypothetical protein